LRWFAAAAAGAGAVAVGGAGIGFVIARRLTAPTGGRVFDLSVRDIVQHEGGDAVVLDRTAHTSAPGLYNLWLEDGGWVRIGPVVGETRDSVTRVVESTTPVGALRAGSRCSWSGIYYRDPADAGLDAVDVVVHTPVGPAPAWLVHPSEGSGDWWTIHIHGLSSPRAGTLRGVAVAAECGLTSLVVTYRNDGEGPTVGTGRSTLGATEMEDVRAAMHYALNHGARRIVLFGWSMGAAIALQMAADAEFRGVVDGLVLESPVLDWQSTINANCARAGLPAWFGVFARPWLGYRALARRIGLESEVQLDHFDWIARADELHIPTLILHGTGDTSATHAVSKRLAGLRPRVILLESFDADHTMTWNSDSPRWRTVVREWLDLLTK